MIRGHSTSEMVPYVRRGRVWLKLSAQASSQTSSSFFLLLGPTGELLVLEPMDFAEGEVLVYNDDVKL